MRKVAFGIVMVLICVLTLAGASAQDSTPNAVELESTVAHLETRVAALSTSAAIQSTQIAELQTAVAQSNSGDSGVMATVEPENLVTLTGIVSLKADSDNIERVGRSDECYGAGGFNDMQIGASVVVRDGSGNTLATGQITKSEYKSSKRCDFSFEVEGVPTGYEFYTVEVTHRGEVTFSEKDLIDQDWEVRLTLGLG